MQERLLRALGITANFLESIKEGVFITDAQGKIQVLNAAFCKLSGFDKEDLSGLTTPYPFWPQEFHIDFTAVFNPGKGVVVDGAFEAILKQKNGVLFPVIMHLIGLRIPTGPNMGHIWLIAPLDTANTNDSSGVSSGTGRISSMDGRENFKDLFSGQRLLAALNERFRRISEGVVHLNSEWCFTYVNDRAGEFLNRSPESLIGKNIWTEYPEGVGLPIYETYQKAFESQENIHFLNHFTPWERWFENRIYPSPEGITVYFKDVTDRELTNYRFEQRDQILRIIHESISQPLFILSVQEDATRFQFLSVSNSFLETLGITQADVEGKYADEFIPEPSLTLALEHYRKAISSNSPAQWEETTPYKTGLKTAIVTVSPLIDEDNQCRYLVGLVQDITERKKAEALLVQKEQYLDNILNNIGDPIFVKDDQSRLLLVNDAFCDLFGLERSKIMGKTLSEDVAPEERESFLRIDREVIESGVENLNEETLTVRGGETRTIATKKSRYVDENGKRYLIGIIRDITARKRAELALQTAKEYSESLIHSMSDGLVVFNTSTAITDVNPAFCEMSGFTEDELLGKECPYPFSPPEIEDESDARHELIAQGKELPGFETIYMKKDGTRFDVRVTISVIRNEKGDINLYFGTVKDITYRKEAERELRRAKEYTDKLIMSMHEGLMVSDPKGKLTFVNDAACKMLGYSREELIGMELPYPYASKESQEAIPEIVDELISGQGPSFQLEYIRKNGERFPVYFSSGTITDDNGRVVGLFGTMKDVSEETKAQRLLEEIAEKSTKKKDVILHLARMAGEDLQLTLEQITLLAAETLQVERVGVWRFQDDDSMIVCEKMYLLSAGMHASGEVIQKEDNPEYFEALETHQTILIEDAFQDKATRKFSEDYLKPNKITSMMDVFINSTHGYYGIICFEHVGESPRKWTAEEHEFATSLANIVSLMIESRERKLAEERLLQTNKELSIANKELDALRTQLERENVYLRDELALVFNFEDMVYGSSAFSHVLSEVEKVAPTNATVLLLGESGTGKELLARAIHNIGERNAKPLIKVNCSAIPRELIESELFGHKKGSFTGAVADKIGKFELADGGTLFLDEIGELPLDMQPKILRFLQEGEIEVVGGTGIKKLNVRVIAATNRNLKEEVEKQRFREDLYFRLNVFPIEVPPLRMRKGDVPILVEHFMDKFNRKYGRNIRFVPDNTMDQLMAYDWPGNIRELENLVERAIILTDSDTLQIPGFESENQKVSAPQKNKDLTLDGIQRNHILQVLDQCDWKISGPESASEILGLKPSTLRDKMSKLGIKRP